MRYTEVLGRILRAVEQIKIDGAYINFPTAVGVQVDMWEQWLQEIGYTERECDKFRKIVRNYLDMDVV